MVNLKVFILSLSIPPILALILFLLSQLSKGINNTFVMLRDFLLILIWYEHILIGKLLLMNTDRFPGFLGVRNWLLYLTMIVNYLIITAFIYRFLLIFN